MNEPFLSVVVITYNQENYIAKTLDSILEQDHDYPYEIVVGEDCSTDGTRDILLKYKEKYPAIIKLLLNEQNLGIVKNYFNVIDHCTGKYIMGCAGDDYWLPGKVKTQIEFMEANPDAGACCGNVQNLYFNGKIKRSHYPNGPLYFDDLMMKYDVIAVTVCLRRTLVTAYVSTVDPLEKGWLMEDYPMMLYIAYNSKIYRLGDILAVYRISENSAMRPHKYNKIKHLQDTVINSKRFIMNLYKIPYTDGVDDAENLWFAWNAAKYKQYEDYKDYISKVNSRNLKVTIKRCIGKYPLLFNLYHYYSRLRCGDKL